MKRIMLYTAVILSILTGLYLVWQFHLIVLLFLMSLFVASAIRPFTDWLVDRGVPLPVAQSGLIFLLVGAFLLLMVLTFRPLSNEMNTAVNWGVIIYERQYAAWETGPEWQQMMLEYLPAPMSAADQQSVSVANVLPVLILTTQGTVATLAGVIFLLVLSVYWSIDQFRFERLFLSLLPVNQRTVARNSWRDVETAVGSYLRSQVAQSALAALVVYIGAVLFQSYFPLLLGLAAGLAALIPLFGGLLATIIAFAVGSLSGTANGIGLMVYTAVTFLILELIVEPRLLSRKQNGLLLIVLLVLILYDSIGVWGIFIAPPLASALEVLILQGYRAYTAQSHTQVQLTYLETKYETLNEKIQVDKEHLSPETVNLARRLFDLIEASRLAEHNKMPEGTPTYD